MTHLPVVVLAMAFALALRMSIGAFPAGATTANPETPSANERLLTLIDRTEMKDASSLLRLLQDPDASAILGENKAGATGLDPTVRQFAAAEIAVREGRCNDALAALGVQGATPTLASRDESMLRSDSALEFAIIDALIVCGRSREAVALSDQLRRQVPAAPAIRIKDSSHRSPTDPMDDRASANWVRARLVAARAQFSAGNLGLARDTLLEIDRAYPQWKGFSQETIDYFALFGALNEFIGDLDRATEFLLSAQALSKQLSGRDSYKTCELELALAEVSIIKVADKQRPDTGGPSTASTPEEVSGLLQSADDRLQRLPGALNLRVKLLQLKASANIAPALPYLDLSREMSAERQQYIDALALLGSAEEMGTRGGLLNALVIAEIRGSRALAELRLGKTDAAIADATATTQDLDQALGSDDPLRIAFFVLESEILKNTSTSKPGQARMRYLVDESRRLAGMSLKQWIANNSTPRERLMYSNSYVIRASLQRLIASHPSTDTRAEYEALLAIKGSAYRAQRYALQGALSGGSHGEDDLKTLRRTQSDETQEVYLSGRTSADPTGFDYVYPARTTKAWRRLSQDFLSPAVVDSLMSVRLQDIQHALEASDVVVDFFPVEMPGEELVIAYVYGSSGDPVRVSISGRAWIKSLEHVGVLVTINSRPLEDEEVRQGVDLASKQAWASIEAAIGKVNKRAQTLYIVPAEILTAIPFELLSTDSANTSFVGDKYDVAYLTSATDLARQQPAATAQGTNVLTISDVNYGANEGLGGIFAGSGPRALRFEPLTCSAKEATDISGILTGAGFPAPDSQSQTNATASAVSTKIGQYDLVHFATRALAFDTSYLSELYTLNGRQPNYNFSGPGEGPDAVVEGSLGAGQWTFTGPGAEFDPLVGVAIVLANANRHDTNNFGFLSASDIALLDLRRVKLVVLSACETTVGAHFSNAGLRGATVAFAYAGAQQVVGGRFDVGDTGTEMFTRFMYQALVAGENPAAALRIARKAMRTEVDSSGNYSLRPPKLWVSFVTYGPQAPVFSPRQQQR